MNDENWFEAHANDLDRQVEEDYWESLDEHWNSLEGEEYEQG